MMKIGSLVTTLVEFFCFANVTSVQIVL
jgi:hypothetical protein